MFLLSQALLPLFLKRTRSLLLSFSCSGVAKEQKEGERERHTSARKEPTQGANHHCIIMTEGTKANSSADGFGFGKAFQEQIDAASRDYILEPRLGE